jgi:hypothetical protein
MSVAVSDIRAVVHCSNTCGPDGSLDTCVDMWPDQPEQWCDACNFLASIPADGMLYDDDDVAEIEAGEDW